MNRNIVVLLIAITLSGTLFAQSEAGAIWLLINPGARADGMGEVGAAIANDVYATYYNPAGLGFLRGREATLMHTTWLPNLASDMYYDFLGYFQFIPTIGTVGGNIILMNLGEQTATDERGNVLGTFESYMIASSASYGTELSRTASVGISVKMIHQHLTNILAGREKGKGYSTNFGFDFGYLKKEFLTKNLTMGATISNIGPKISFIDVNQADPMPTNLKLGFGYTIEGEYNKFSIAYDINKLLVASYPDRDLDNNGKIGGHGDMGEYNSKNKREVAHTDEWYVGIFTSWIDDWLLVENGSLKREFEKLTHNLGMEYWYSDLFAIRFGFIYDKLGKILMKDKWPVPTFGAGLRYAGMGFDFGYTAGDPGHPRQNTMLFSLNLKF